jgi:nucleoside-diphosphate-sugar epimerase
MPLGGRAALVTGATGTVGSVVTRRLASAGCRVRPVSRRELGDPALLWRAARTSDFVVHCAGATLADLTECRRANVDTTRNLVSAALAARCTLVHLSTLSVYDDGVGPTFDEQSRLWTQPGSVYGFTKAEAERIVRAGGARGLAAIILRPGMVLSMHPRSRWGPLALERARASGDSILPFPEIPYVHVDNLAEAVVLAASRPAARGRAYNVVDGVGDGAEYLAAVYGALGRPAPPVPPDAPRLRFAAEKIRAELGYAPVDRWKHFLAELSGLRAG